MPFVFHDDAAFLFDFSLFPSLFIGDSIPSYGDRANTYEAVIDYFRTHFLQVHRRNNENRRVLYTHFTSVVVSRFLAPARIAC